MSVAFRAALAYFSAVFVAGFFLGALRAWLVAPKIGELAAVALELPIILYVSYRVCDYLVRRLHVGVAVAQRIAMGAFAFVMLMTAELAIAVCVFERTLSSYALDLQTPAGMLGLVGQLLFATFPYWQLRRLR